MHLFICFFVTYFVHKKGKRLIEKDICNQYDRPYKCQSLIQPVLDRVENIVGKGENAGYQHFLRFPQSFQKPPSSLSLKVRIVW